MEFERYDPARESFALRGEPRGIELEADGVRHPRSARSRRAVLTRYSDLTHVTTSDRYLWIGARSGVYMVPRVRFKDRNAPERAAHAILLRVGAALDGAATLARMAAIDDLAGAPTARLATRTLGGICLLAYALQLLAGPNVFTVGYFSSVLVADGDLWRLATANLLHGFPVHLVLNLFGLFIVGRLVERALGTRRTLVVMGASALVAMLASGLFERGAVVGASGIVFGLVGAVLWLEFRRASELPAWWRFPRPLLAVVLGALGLDMALGFALTIVAGEAHLGGLAGGLLATALVTRDATLGSPPRRGLRLAAASVVAVTGISVLSAAVVLLAADDFTARHATRLAGLPGVTPDELNNHAWLIAIEPESTDAQMRAALRLAERAVSETERSEPTLLDTLAEVQFQLGSADEAVATIDEAIAMAPLEPYYREQRRRFTGERAADDRPPDPALRLPQRPADPPPPSRGDPGLTV